MPAIQGTSNEVPQASEQLRGLAREGVGCSGTDCPSIQKAARHTSGKWCLKKAPLSSDKRDSYPLPGSFANTQLAIMSNSVKGLPCSQETRMPGSGSVCDWVTSEMRIYLSLIRHSGKQSVPVSGYYPPKRSCTFQGSSDFPTNALCDLAPRQ